MLALQRRRKILDLLQEEGSARVSALSRMFKVSEPTVRQDLEKLEEEGHIIREHGGAFLKSVPQQVKSLSLQHLENMDKKVRIGRKAAEFISDDDSLILDSGSTITEIAKNLGSKKNLKVITNALNIALLLGTEMSCEIMVTGGEFKAPTLSLTGESAAKLFERIHVGKCFLAAGGISLDAGLTYPGFNDLYVKKAMIEAASEVYLVADSTKIGKASFASLGPIELVKYFVTDEGMSDTDRKAFEARGVIVIIA
jgi:DeoR/GlpR family transcriptional regulator of sugar metabolism